MLIQLHVNMENFPSLYFHCFGIFLSAVVLFTSLIHCVAGVDNEYEQSTPFGAVPSFTYDISK